MTTTRNPVEAASEALAASSLGSSLRRDVPIGPLTTYRVGGSASLFLTVEDRTELLELSAITSLVGVDVLVVGRGSNMLVADSGFHGLAVVLGPAFARVEIRGTRVIAGGAALLPVVARSCAEAGLGGFEWAVGVPGSIGGAVRMNAGGHGADMAASLVSVEVVDLARGGVTTSEPGELALGYRTSSLESTDVVVSAELELRAGDSERSRAEMAEIVRWRRANQPGGQNAGSVFTNPRGDSAGRLIDTAGARGMRVGTAEVSTKHANFIQADEGGTAADIVALMSEVKRRVLPGEAVVKFTPGKEPPL
ncbi:MAG: UDP-N-acetylmuramate dehydrogenase, partial [Acidimicrobiales bacterium]